MNLLIVLIGWLLVVVDRTTAEQTIRPSFTPIGLRAFSRGSNFSSLLLIDNALYVGAKDSIFKLDASNVENMNGPGFVSISLPSNSEQKEQCIGTYYDDKLCSNFIKSILNRVGERDLYICGTYSFQPRLFQFTYDLTLIKEDDGYGYCSLNPLDSSTAIWIESGNPMNIPSLYSASLLDASTKTQPVDPVIYRPELKRGDKSFQYLRTPKFDSDWLYQPKFIKSFDVDDYVLFFVREKSLEQIAEGQDTNYARVYRVCKSDMGSVSLGNQWSSMRKTRLTCVYNNTYLNDLEDVIRVNDDSFVGLFSLKLPNQKSVSFLCQFKKQSIINGLNLPANNFKEIAPGTQYWSKMSADKVPKNIPSQCNYNSQSLKDDITNFVKTHCLIGDHIEGTLTNFVPNHAVSLAVDSITTGNANKAAQGSKVSETTFSDDSYDDAEMKVNIFYLGTVDGRVIKVSNLDSSLVIAEWKLGSGDELINEIKLKPPPQQQQQQGSVSLYAATDRGVYQVDVPAQCGKYYICNLCMRDPHCGWNIKKNKCEWAAAAALTTSLASLNLNLCSRLQRQENVKTIQLDGGAFALLECSLDDPYLFEHIEWRRGQQVVDLNGAANMFLTWSKDLIILAGNSSLNGIYNCYVDKTELISSYSVTFKPSEQRPASSSSSLNQKCITAENYIKQYNNWCDEYNRYHRALNEWEDLKDKTCSSSSPDLDKN